MQVFYLGRRFISENVVKDDGIQKEELLNKNGIKSLLRGPFYIKDSLRDFLNENNDETQEKKTVDIQNRVVRLHDKTKPSIFHGRFISEQLPSSLKSKVTKIVPKYISVFKGQRHGERFLKLYINKDLPTYKKNSKIKRYKERKQEMSSK